MGNKIIFTDYVSSFGKNEGLNKIIECAKEIHKIGINLRPYTEINNNLRRFYNHFEILEKIKINHSIFNSPLYDLIENLSSTFEKLDEIRKQTPKDLLLLAGYGWYLEYDSDFDLPIRLGKYISQKKINIVNKFLIHYYSENFERIIDILSERHSERKEIFKQIYLSYQNKQFFVSIPTILTQIDGISSDASSKMFFIKDRNKPLPQIAEEILKINDLTFDYYLSPLTNKTPIRVNSTELNSFPDKLNRHHIIHGIDKCYGTEINNLKCLSLLKYISDIITIIYPK
jgi:hypothetical protein